MSITDISFSLCSVLFDMIEREYVLEESSFHDDIEAKWGTRNLGAQEFSVQTESSLETRASL